MRNTEAEPVLVAVGVLVKNREVLIAKRPEGVHLSSYWEFPGGKVDPGEKSDHALMREFREELDIEIGLLTRLFRISHSYPEKKVELEVYGIGRFTGEPRGVEGQEVQWCALECLDQFSFPPANAAILDYLRASAESL